VKIIIHSNKLGWYGTGAAPHYVSYSRAGDATSLIYNDGWRMMFERDYNTDGFRRNGYGPCHLTVSLNQRIPDQIIFTVWW
jgi:hypothetical protein